MPASNTTLSLILIALGVLGVILSFLVPDRKKSLISIILALIIVITGLVQFGQQSFSRYRWQKRMNRFQRDRVDFDELRKKLNEQTAETRKAVKDLQPKKNP